MSVYINLNYQNVHTLFFVVYSRSKIAIYWYLWLNVYVFLNILHNISQWMLIFLFFWSLTRLQQT